MGQWNDRGFVAGTLDEYKTNLQAAFIRAYGSDFALDDSTPQGVLITAIAEMFFNMDMDGIEAFSRMNINSASGVFLDMIGGIRGVERSQGTPQVASVLITCSSENFQPFTIAEGTLFTGANSTATFVSAVGKNIDATTATITLDYSESGDSGMSVGDKLTCASYAQIVDIEIVGLVAGTGRESDLSYRQRLQTEYPAAQGTIEFVENKIYETGLADDVGANYNDTDQTVGLLPPYTTEWMAVPKDGIDINAFKDKVAEAIVNSKVPGSPTYGNTTVSVADVFGTLKTVNFTIPTKVELEIDCRVTTPETTGVLSLLNVPTIREAIADYINHLRVGKDVSYARCIYPLAADEGFDILTFKIREKGDPDWVVDGNYTIGDREYARIQTSDIKVGI